VFHRLNDLSDLVIFADEIRITPPPADILISSPYHEHEGVWADMVISIPLTSGIKPGARIAVFNETKHIFLYNGFVCMDVKYSFTNDAFTKIEARGCLKPPPGAFVPGIGK